MENSSPLPKSIKNYRYSVYLPKELPEEFWEKARSMNELWNEMLDARDRFSFKISEVRRKARELPTNEKLALFPAESAEIKATSKEEKVIWETYSRDLPEISNSPGWKERLNWEARGFLLDKFQTASARVFKQRGKLSRKSKFLTKIVVPHRFTNGGWEAENVFAGRSKKAFIKPLPAEFFDANDWQSRRSRITTGYYGFGIGNTLIPVRILLHCKLPSDALIKQTQLNGKFDHLSRRWNWHLTVTCQFTCTEETKPFSPVAAIDLNYRRIEHYLRIAYIVDSCGNQFEIRLPITEKPSRRLRNALKTVNKARSYQKLSELPMEEFFPVTIFDVWDWQAKNDLLLEEFKEKIARSVEPANENLPQEIRLEIKNLPKMRRTGLLKLWRLSNAATDDSAVESLREINQLLGKWKYLDLENLKKIKTTSAHLINKRNKLYENISLWLKNNYSNLIYEKDFSLKEIAEEAPKISLNSENIAIRLGAKYRRYAALYFLLQKLNEQSTNNWLIGAPMKNTTKKCCICCALWRPDQEITNILY